MKKIFALTLVLVLLAATCLPTYAATYALTDYFCEPCDKVRLDYDVILVSDTLNRVIECPKHGTHDAEERFKIYDHCCPYHGIVLQTVREIYYACLD